MKIQQLGKELKSLKDEDKTADEQEHQPLADEVGKGRSQEMGTVHQEPLWLY